MKRFGIGGSVAKGLFALLATLSLGATSLPTESEPAPDWQARKEYKGFQDEEPGCDFQFLRGWFFWYVDTSLTCYTVPVSSEIEADRRAREVLEHSFSVIISGYGLGTF